MMKMLRATRKAFSDSASNSLLSLICRTEFFVFEYHTFSPARHKPASTSGPFTARFPSGFLDNITSSEDAINLYKQMVRIRPPPSVVAFAQLLGRVSKMKHHWLAISFYNDMNALGFPVNYYILTIVINCFCLSKRVDFGFSVLGGFFKRGIVPDVCTFTTLLKGLFKERRISLAQELFKKIIAEKLCDPNVVMCATVIDGLCKVGNTSMALIFLRDIERGRLEPNVIVYNAIIDGLCKDDRIDDAVLLFREMIDKGIVM